MYIKFFFIVMLALVLSAAGVYMSKHQHLDTKVDAATFAQNVHVLGRYAGDYAGAHDTTTSAVSTTTLGTPSWFAPYPGLQAYVSNGSAYVYFPSGLSVTPSQALTFVAGPQITAGLKAGVSIKDATGRALPTSVPMPGAIPDGSMVYVSRDVVATAVPPAPGNSTQTAPGALPPGAPLGPPQSFAGFTSAPVPWLPNSPPWTNPPSSTIAATPPPPPPPPVSPPSVPAFSIGINGGYTYTEGRKAGMGTCTLGSFNTFVLWDASIGNPATTYTMTMTRAGKTVVSTLPSTQVQCAQSCALTGGLMTDAQALAFTPEITWSKLVYLKAVSTGSGYQFYGYPLDMSVSLKACNVNGCSTTNETSQDLKVFSIGTTDCQAAQGQSVYYPPTAYP